jgi:tripartite-type tricarboxylate transporter receptor subunit TctC
VPEQETELLIGVVAPAGTPADTVSFLHKQIGAIVALPDVVSTLTTISFQAVASTPEEFARQIKDDIAVWGKVMKDAGIAMN